MRGTRVTGKKRVKGIEPSCPAWEAGVLPLNYTRKRIFDFRLSMADLQAQARLRSAADPYCQETTSSEPLYFPSPLVPHLLSLPQLVEMQLPETAGHVPAPPLTLR